MLTAVQIAEALDEAGYVVRRELSGKVGPRSPGSAMPEYLRELGLIEMVDLRTTAPRVRATNRQMTKHDDICEIVCICLPGEARKADRMLLWRKAGMVRDDSGKWLRRTQKAIARDLGVHRNTVRNRLTALYVEISECTKKLVHLRAVQNISIAA